MRFLIIFSALAILTQYVVMPPARADTRYVSDQLIITLRQGKSTQHRIIKTLKTGTPLEVLEEDKTYLKVRTEDGVEGYVLRQYISSNPPKTERIRTLEKLNQDLENKVAALEEARNSLQMQLDSLQANYSQKFSTASAATAELEQKLEEALADSRGMTEKYDNLLAKSENVVEISAERDLLLQQNKKLKSEASELLLKNEKLTDARMIKWFLAGGGVFFLGWIIGKISRKKRSRF